MAIRTVISCDRCEAEPAEHLEIDLGDGLQRLDLDAACQQALGLDALAALLAEAGVAEPTGAKKPGPKPGPTLIIRCPICGEDGRGGRTRLVRHVMAMHDKDKTEAGRLIPPQSDKPTVDCAICGFSVAIGQGYAAHVRINHSPEDWQRIKADRTAAG